MSACKHRTSNLAISSGCPLKTQGICHSFCVFATAGEELLTFKAFPPFQLATAAWAVRDGLQRNTKTSKILWFFLLLSGRGGGLRQRIWKSEIKGLFLVRANDSGWLQRHKETVYLEKWNRPFPLPSLWQYSAGCQRGASEKETN